MRSLIFLGFLLGLLSCNKERIETDSINPKVLHVPLGKEKLNASKIFEEITYLRLKGNGDLYPSKADQVEILNHEIYIMDKSLSSIFRFSSTGDLLGILSKQGEGPDEYQYLHRFLIDHEKKTIEVYDKVGQKILVYDKDFKFIESFKIGLFFENFTKIGDKKYLVYTAQENVYNDKLLENNLLIWNDGVIEYAAIPGKGTDSRFQYKGISKSPNKDKIYVTQSFNDTIYSYSIKGNIIDNKIFINFDNPLIGTYNDVDEIKEKNSQSSYSSNLDYIISSDKILSFNYYHREIGILYMMNYYYFVEQQKSLSSKGLINDFDNFNIFEHLLIKGDTLINVIEPDYLSMINIENTSQAFQNAIDLNLPFEDQMIVLFLKLKDPSTIDFD